jgi:glycosyltransferase involved in cell wall biosynthesis
MKVAIVVNSSWAAYNFRLNLAKSFQNEGNQVVFIVPFDGNFSGKLQKHFECYNLNINPNSTNPFVDLKLFANLFLIYRKIKPNIICHFTIKLNIYGSVAARFCKIPNIGNITGLGTVFINRSLITFFVEWLYKFALFFSSKTFFQNKEDLEYFLNKRLIAKSKVGLLPGSGVDLNKFKYSPLLEIHSEFKFLMISRLIKDKGLYEYVEASKILKNRYPNKLVKFQLLGELNVLNKSAIEKSELKEWINQGLIDYLGSTDQVQDKILDCHCVVLPSYREGMPRVILEAFAVGRPSIVTNVTGCRAIVDDKINGLLCKVKSSKDLAEKMSIMIQLPYHKRVKFAENARNKVEIFYDEKIVINEYVKAIKKLLSDEKNL